MRDWPWVDREDGFLSRWAVARSIVLSLGIAVVSPDFDVDFEWQSFIFQ